MLQETDNFKVFGFNIFPVFQITDIRYNKSDMYYDKIMLWENEKKEIALKTKVNLTNWKTIFKTFQKQKKNVIVECENPKIDSFTIGIIERVTDKSVFVLYFDSKGFIDENPTKIKYKDISKVTFDDRYIDVFSKYLRKKKN